MIDSSRNLAKVPVNQGRSSQFTSITSILHILAGSEISVIH